MLCFYIINIFLATKIVFFFIFIMGFKCRKYFFFKSKVSCCWPNLFMWVEERKDLFSKIKKKEGPVYFKTQYN